MDLVSLTDSQVWGMALALVMMATDVIVGFVVAVINAEVSSTKMRHGLLHKVLLILLIIVCLAIEIAVGRTVQLPYDVPTCEVVCAYIVIMELASVLENIAKGYPEFADSPLFRLFNLKDKED